jgi:hypothetical protein
MALLDAKPGALRPEAADGAAVDSVAEDRAAGAREGLRGELRSDPVEVIINATGAPPCAGHPSRGG